MNDDPRHGAEATRTDSPLPDSGEGTRPVSAFIAKRLMGLLAEHRVVAWYDGARVFGDLVRQLEPELVAGGCALVSAADSTLAARRTADAAYRRLGQPDDPTAPKRLLIYIPARRGQTDEAKQIDPFELYARCGRAFGDEEADQLRGLAEAALPGHAAAIARLFAGGKPPLATLDELGAASGARFPLVRQALGSDSPVEALANALSRPDVKERLARVPGALGELAGLAESVLGLPPIAREGWPTLHKRLLSFVLMGELAATLPGGLPAALAGVAHAAGQGQATALAICARLRESDTGRLAFTRAARELEDRLHLATALGPDPALGAIDTFPLQDRARLRAVVGAAREGDLATARAIFAAAESSPWRREEDRQPVWIAAKHCLAFLEVAAESDPATHPAGRQRSVRGLVERYVAADGLWRQDQAQRRFEQAGAACANDVDIDELLQHCRSRYLAALAPAQHAFQQAVKEQGWPPDGIRRQTQTFDIHVTPELTERRKIAYFLVDSLRYEMGRDLAEALADLGAANVEGVAAALPTYTPNGMAALLPGADGALALPRHGDDVIPAIGGTLLPTLDDRRNLVKTRLGDRYVDLELDDVLQKPPQKLAKQIGSADLVVVRSLDLDDLGEGRSAFRARKYMSGVIGDLKIAVGRLIAIGFGTFVIAADHGHVLVPEIPAGDVVAPPAGEWLLRKRRCLIGWHRSDSPGVLILRAAEVGIQSDAPELEYAAAAGYQTFGKEDGYFHEGLSLQECVVPVVTLRAAGVATPVGSGTEQVTIAYRSDRFTSSVVGLKVTLTAMFAPALTVRLEAFDGSGPKAHRIGRAGDCDSLDPVTGEVTLTAGRETSVPLVIDPDFSGPSIEVRATDPRTGVVYGKPLKLKNARID